MKLFLLEAKDDEKPWSSTYDMFFGWVIRAENEAQARQMAQEKGGDEVGGRRGTIPAWTDPSLSTCRELTADGPAEIVLSDFNAG